MGYKSTAMLTRKDAILRMVQALMSPSLTDEELADALEAMVGERECYNYSIVSEEELKKD